MKKNLLSTIATSLTIKSQKVSTCRKKSQHSTCPEFTTFPFSNTFQIIHSNLKFQEITHYILIISKFQT